MAGDPQVMVVGAGPTGLLLAAELARRDVSFELVDALDAPQGWDRATVVHERSLQIFEALGIAEPLIEVGVRTRGVRFHSGGEMLVELSFDTGGRYGFQLGLSEEATESALSRYLESRGAAVTRSTRLVNLEPGDNSVTARLERDGERIAVTADWLVGCDGHHSFVREAAGIEYAGETIPGTWAVFDATVEGWADDYDLVFPFLDQPLLILTPLPGRRWRAYLRPTSDASDLVAEAEGVLRRYVPDARFVDVDNPTRFRCHSRVASAYRAGRVLLAGDAAHACSPNEGHGMNTGLQDAFNLGWKLALVCRGDAGEELLDTYETERRPVAELIVASGAAVEAAHALTGAAERAERDAGMREALGDPETAHHEAAAAAEIDRNYARSRAVAGGGAGALTPGRLLPDTTAVQPASGELRALHELAGNPGHTLFVLGGPRADGGAVADLVAALEPHVGVAVDSVIGLSTDPQGADVGQIDPALAAELGISGVTVLAVRPDRYIGLRDDSGEPQPVAAYLDALLA